MGDRGVDVERLARDRLLLGRGKARERAHVVEAVGELDDDDANVLSHRQEHLAKVLDLRVLLRLIRNSRKLRDAVDEARDLGAELLGDLLAGHGGILDDVVQQSGGDRLMVHLELGENPRNRQWVLDVGLTRGSALALMSGHGELVDAPQPLRVGGGLVAPDSLDQLLDRHGISRYYNPSCGVGDGAGVTFSTSSRFLKKIVTILPSASSAIQR